jgi:hypothetical protein
MSKTSVMFATQGEIGILDITNNTAKILVQYHKAVPSSDSFGELWGGAIHPSKPTLVHYFFFSIIISIDHRS